MSRRTSIRRNHEYSFTYTLDQPRRPTSARGPRCEGGFSNSINDRRLPLSRIPNSARLSRLAAVTALVAGSASCSDTLLSAGPTPAQAEARADQLFEGFAARFNSVELAPKYAVARIKLAQSALVPSKIFNDSAVWEAQPSAKERELFVNGFTAPNGHYRLESHPSLGTTQRPGDTRHVITLQQTGPSTFHWDTSVELSIGSITAENISVLISTLLAAPQTRAEAELRQDYRSAVPRATALLSHGFDTLHVTPGPSGTTSVVMTLAFRPDLMKPVYPALAGYLDKYLGPAKYHFAFADHSGAPVFDVLGRDRTMTIRYRLDQGKLTTLAGPPKPWPDTLQLTSDLTLKVKHLTVGFHSLLTDVAIDNEGHDRGYTFVSQHEPKWDLPFVTERLLRSPLRHPFEGDGALFSITVRDSVGAQSALGRHVKLNVQESAIMKFLGLLASHAMGDLDARVEADEDRFIRDLFTSLQADLKAQGSKWKKED